jgi:hypothetical protein
VLKATACIFSPFLSWQEGNAAFKAGDLKTAARAYHTGYVAEVLPSYFLLYRR